MRTVNVLLLDGTETQGHFAHSRPPGILYEVTTEKELGHENCYSFTRELANTIGEMTNDEDENIELVIVGNNMGAGVAKARAIADDMKEMTVVVWNSYHHGVERPYAALGLKQRAAAEVKEEAGFHLLEDA